MVPILSLGLKNKGTEEEPRAPVPWASPLLGLKAPKNENQRRDTGKTGGRVLDKDTRIERVKRVGVCCVELGCTPVSG